MKVKELLVTIASAGHDLTPVVEVNGEVSAVTGCEIRGKSLVITATAPAGKGTEAPKAEAPAPAPAPAKQPKGKGSPKSETLDV
jgi:hypothetical protein